MTTYLAAEEAHRERVQHAAALQQIGLGPVVLDAEPGAAGIESLAQIGQLLRREQHAVAAQPGDERRLREQIDDEADQQVDEGDAERADHEQQPDQHAEHERDRAERALARIDQFIGHRVSLPVDAASIGTPVRRRSAAEDTTVHPN